MRKWNLYTTNEIKPDGWLKNQLMIQAKGLSGNLDKVWRDVRDSLWIGGAAEGWERVPYWLDGFIPLAYLLEDEDMIARGKKYINAIISAQKEDGWICPCSDAERENYDTWAVLLITKVLVGYYECSGDERIIKVVYDTLKNYYSLLRDKKIKLFEWGKYRWFEGFIAINFIYERYKEDWLVELARILKMQGTDYNTLTEAWKRPLNQWGLDTHIVNMAMMLKYEAVSYEILGEEYMGMADNLYNVLYKYNNTPVGTFTGDECLSGLSPIQGTELCSVVELMYSCELLYAYTGDKKWAQRLEILAFNALPSTISDDMWTHQYVQMSNQIACIKFGDPASGLGKPIFRTNGPEAHLFGLEPNFGCCTSNFNQGWPKFALSAFMHKDDTIINSVPVPSRLDCDKAEICLETEYPFENSFRYKISAKKDFIFKIRIPDFAKKLTVNGILCEEELSFELKAKEKKEIYVSFETKPYIEKRPNNLNTIKCGSLVFSVPIKYEKKMYEYEKNGVERKFPYCDYEYIPLSDWNVAYCSEKIVPQKNKVSNIPFSSEHPPVTLKAMIKNINWGFEDGYDTVCAKTPYSTKAQSEAKEIELYPYGCAKLRMTELPLIE